VAAYFKINTVVEGSTITPLHYLFARYIADDSMIDKLFARIEKIDFEKTNIKTLVQLTK
jgi:hypothetical protein